MVISTHDSDTSDSAPDDDSVPRRGRGRPKTFDRERVVEVALRQYWSEGTDGVSLNELSRLAGVSKPAIYREFGGEDGLMDAALEHYSKTYLAAVSEYTTTDAPFGQALMQLVDMMIDHDPELPAGCLLAKMRVLSAKLGTATRTRVETLRAGAQQDYAAWIDRAKSRGELASDVSTDVAAAFIDAQLTSLLMQVALGEDPEMLRAHARLTFAGLLATPNNSS